MSGPDSSMISLLYGAGMPSRQISRRRGFLRARFSLLMPLTLWCGPSVDKRGQGPDFFAGGLLAVQHMFSLAHQVALASGCEHDVFQPHSLICWQGLRVTSSHVFGACWFWMGCSRSRGKVLEPMAERFADNMDTGRHARRVFWLTSH